MKSTDTDLPYAPPHGGSERSGDGAQDDQVVRDSTRLAGFLLIATSALDVLSWVNKVRSGLSPHWIWVLPLIALAGLGVCLILFGRPAVSVARGVVLLSFAYIVARGIINLYNHAAGQLGFWWVLAALLTGPALNGTLRALPLWLLLVAPTPRRRKMAIVLFVCWLLIGALVRAM